MPKRPIKVVTKQAVVSDASDDDNDEQVAAHDEQDTVEQQPVQQPGQQPGQQPAQQPGQQPVVKVVTFKEDDDKEEKLRAAIRPKHSPHRGRNRRHSPPPPSRRRRSLSPRDLLREISSMLSRQTNNLERIMTRRLRERDYSRPRADQRADQRADPRADPRAEPRADPRVDQRYQRGDHINTGDLRQYHFDQQYRHHYPPVCEQEYDPNQPSF